MKIFTAKQIREADRYTIEHEPVSSIRLMERAALKFTERFTELYSLHKNVVIICGNGNNGGDGLAVARQLLEKGYKPEIFLLLISDVLSPDAQMNLSRLPDRGVHMISETAAMPVLGKNTVVIDAIFGTGLNRPATGFVLDVIRYINNSDAEVVSVDMPSGLLADEHNPEHEGIIRATRTMSFQFPKLAFLLCENSIFTGEWEILDIGLSDEFISDATARYNLISPEMVSGMLKHRERCAHKGTFGHSLLIAGSYGKMGAAILSGSGCLRSGTGLLTIHAPDCGYEILQTALPEAMLSTDKGNVISSIPELDKYDVIGCGPGIGSNKHTDKALEELLTKVSVPTVLDADALNILAESKEWFKYLNKNHILTPHPKEFARLAGKSGNDFERLQKATAFAKDHHCTLILKSAYTSIHLADGTVWFNSTGNPGMASGGTGDVLTGILTGLLAQGYSYKEASMLGVCLHGMAGDIAAGQKSEWAMTAGDLCDCLGDAYLKLSGITAQQ